MTGITLIAQSGMDGWAYVEEDGQLYQLRTPYEPDCWRPATPHELERAITDEGFEPLAEPYPSFDDREQLYNHLRSLIRESRDRAGQPLGQARITPRLLEQAPDRVRTRYLDRVEAWITAGQRAPAQSMLAAFIASPVLMTDETWRPRIVALNSRLAAQSQKAAKPPVTRRFGHLDRRFETVELQTYLASYKADRLQLQPRSSVGGLAAA